MFNIFALFIISGTIIYNRKIITEVIYSKYNKIKQLNDAVRSTDENITTFSVYKKTCSIIFTMFKDDCKTYFNTLFPKKNYTKKLNKKKYEVTYNINDKEYKLIITHSSLPHNLNKIVNENNEIVTDKLLPYLGPEYNWHFTKFTPSFFGYKKLIFYHLDGSETLYDSNTVLEKL